MIWKSHSKHQLQDPPQQFKVIEFGTKGSSFQKGMSAIKCRDRGGSCTVYGIFLIFPLKKEAAALEIMYRKNQLGHMSQHSLSWGEQNDPEAFWKSGLWMDAFFHTCVTNMWQNWIFSIPLSEWYKDYYLTFSALITSRSFGYLYCVSHVTLLECCLYEEKCIFPRFSTNLVSNMFHNYILPELKHYSWFTVLNVLIFILFHSCVEE